ncbi:MAG: hypothetical protein ACM3S4_09855, partial [Burkholderiales bacterium]
TALSEMGQQLSIAGLGTKIAPPVLEGELCQKCNRSIDNVEVTAVCLLTKSCLKNIINRYENEGSQKLKNA